MPQGRPETEHFDPSVERFIARLPDVVQKYEANHFRYAARGLPPPEGTLVHPRVTFGTLGDHATTRMLLSVVTNHTYHGQEIPRALRERAFDIYCNIRRVMNAVVNKDEMLYRAFEILLRHLNNSKRVAKPPSEMVAYLYALAQTKSRYPDYGHMNPAGRSGEEDRFLMRHMFNPPDLTMSTEEDVSDHMPARVILEFIEALFRYLNIRAADLHNIHYQTEENQRAKPLDSEQAKLLQVQARPDKTAQVTLAGEPISYVVNPHTTKVALVRKFTNPHFSSFDLRLSALVAAAEDHTLGTSIDSGKTVTLLYSEHLEYLLSEAWKLYIRALSSLVSADEIAEFINRTYNSEIPFGFNVVEPYPAGGPDISEADMPLGVHYGFWARALSGLSFLEEEYFGGSLTPQKREVVPEPEPARPDILSSSDSLELKRETNAKYEIEASDNLFPLPLLFESEYPDEALPFELEEGNPNIKVTRVDPTQYEYNGTYLVLIPSPRNAICTNVKLAKEDLSVDTLSFTLRREPRGDLVAVIGKPVQITRLVAEFEVKPQPPEDVEIVIDKPRLGRHIPHWERGGYTRMARALQSLFVQPKQQKDSLEELLSDRLIYTHNADLPQNPNSPVIGLPHQREDGRIPVQCTGATAIADFILGAVVPELDVASRSCIKLRRKDGAVIVSPHSVLEILDGDQVSIFDITPNSEDRYKQEEVRQIIKKTLGQLVAIFTEAYPQETRQFPRAITDLCGLLELTLRSRSFINIEILQKHLAKQIELWEAKLNETNRKVVTQYFGESQNTKGQVLPIIYALSRYLELKNRYD